MRTFYISQFTVEKSVNQQNTQRAIYYFFFHYLLLIVINDPPQRASMERFFNLLDQVNRLKTGTIYYSIVFAPM